VPLFPVLTDQPNYVPRSRISDGTKRVKTVRVVAKRTRKIFSADSGEVEVAGTVVQCGVVRMSTCYPPTLVLGMYQFPATGLQNNSSFLWNYHMRPCIHEE
jgi:hypothetical protein